MTAALAIASLGLAACGSSVAIDSRPVAELAHAAPPAELTADCADPVAIPPGPLNEGPAERLWISDRRALLDCGERHHGLAAFIAGRDAGLAGVKK